METTSSWDNILWKLPENFEKKKRTFRVDFEENVKSYLGNFNKISYITLKDILRHILENFLEDWKIVE